MHADIEPDPIRAGLRLNLRQVRGAKGFELAPAAPDASEYANNSIIGHAGGTFRLAAGPNVVRFRVPDNITSRL
ncbi:MAG: hypothetical protein AAB252_03895, partial [Pseudomonadota bacterium]